MVNPVVSQFRKSLRQLIATDGRSRREIASSVEISVSALSQYEHGTSTPRLTTLVALATTLGVSLDQLVLGSDSGDRHGLPLKGTDLATAIAAIQYHQDAVTETEREIWAAIRAMVKDTARQAVLSERRIAGALSLDEVLTVERSSTNVRLATAFFEHDIIETKTDGEVTVAPGPFVGVIADAVARGTKYHWIVPQGAKWRRQIDRLALMLRDVIEDAAAVEANILFSEVPHVDLSPGFFIYEVDPGHVPPRVRSFVTRDGHIGVYELPTRTFSYFPLVPTNELRHLSDRFDRLAKDSQEYTPQPGPPE